MPEPPAGPVDQHLLAGLNLSLVQKALQRDGSRLGQARSFLVGHAGRHSRQGALWHAHVLREPAHMAQDVREHLLARLEERRVRTRRLNLPCNVRPEYVMPGPERAHDAGIQRFPPQRLPVRCVQGYRVYFDQHLVVLGRGRLHIHQP
jgi:hypothetical protein